ncbi:MAG: LptF/LptG family permease [Porphyromonas sp.]|nr:LptF/LptG family permease [Porphyromonas sp.]
MGLKKLYKYIIKTFVPLLLISFVVTLFILVMQMLWFYVGDLVGKGIDALVFLKLLFYASMTATPLALILSILLASLMTFGNLGERLELLAMKAAGIPLTKILQPIFWSVVLLSIGLFVFQNDLMITSQVRFWQYYFSIKNKSPELAIPEGSFYKDLPGYSIYVKKKDTQAQMMHGLMIYDLTEGFEDTSVIVADSGRIYSTADSKGLILELYSGESFRNLPRENHAYGNALRPYLRERFETKEVHIPFSADFDMMDESILSSQFVGKNLIELSQYTDSLSVEIDSLATLNTGAVLNNHYTRKMTESGRPATVKTPLPEYIARPDNRGADQRAEQEQNPPKEYRQLPPEEQAKYDVYAKISASGLQAKSQLTESVLSRIRDEQNRTFYSVTQQRDLADLYRKNRFEYWRKFTFPVACITFFLVGAPLGALIRRGGLGVPFIVAVFFFIIFYILESFGMKMVREGTWQIWAGMWLPNMALAPIGLLLSYVATKDSTRFNVDVITNFMQRFFGTQTARKLSYKEVTMTEVDFDTAKEDIRKIETLANELTKEGNMGYFDFYLKDAQYERRQELNDMIEDLVKNLSNARDRLLVHQLGGYPFLRDLSRTMRAKNTIINILLMLIFPLGLLIYIIYTVRNKKYIKELKYVRSTNHVILEEIERVESRTKH